MKVSELFINSWRRMTNLIQKLVKLLKKQPLEERLKDNFAKRYPNFPQHLFTPLCTPTKSPCCKAVLWEFYWGLGELFCDKCGKRYQLELKLMYGRRTLDELHKYLSETSEENRKTQ